MNATKILLTLTLIIGAIAVIGLSFEAKADQTVIYKTMKNGIPSFSNHPTGDAQIHQLLPTTTIAPVKSFTRNVKPMRSTLPVIPYTTLKIETDLTNPIVHPNFPFVISTSVVPALQSDHQLQLFIDGRPTLPPSHNTVWHLNNLPTGHHNINVHVLDGTGKIIKSSQYKTFVVLRPTYNR